MNPKLKLLLKKTGYFIGKILGVSGKRFVSDRLKELAWITRTISRYMHTLQWGFDWLVPPQPEWGDHFGDQFWLMRSSQNPLWLERGIFNLLCIKQGATLLEICCGDGFNAYHFYSIRCKNIISIDFDVDAIRHAKKFNQASNVEFRLQDIRNGLPEGSYDNIIWDAAIEHFTEKEIEFIMVNIKQRLKKGGTVSGYTIKELEGGKQLSHHEYEFKSKEDLRRFFEPHFSNVMVFETIYPNRHNFYFYASDEILPFQKSWEFITYFHSGSGDIVQN
ncbi:MAG: class I SAM-dependent methyltransferase [Spirosomataceae bacterium]